MFTTLHWAEGYGCGSGYDEEYGGVGGYDDRCGDGYDEGMGVVMMMGMGMG